MKDNVLKKEFKSKDVQRARNLIQGKVGDKTGLGVGYSKKDEFYQEGDIWEVVSGLLKTALNKILLN